MQRTVVRAEISQKMTNETIQLILDSFNSGLASEVVVRQIGQNVWWGFAWGPTPNGYHDFIEIEGYEMFFVKAPDGDFAAAVLRHGSDEMHWYVADKHRRNGILVEPLKKVILPFIFKYHQTTKQSGSIDVQSDCGSSSMKLAKRVGFRIVKDDGKKALVEVDHDIVQAPTWTGEKPTCEELEQVRTEAKTSIRQVGIAIDKLRVVFGDQIKFEKLDDLLFRLRDIDLQIVDCVEDAKWALKPADNS